MTRFPTPFDFHRPTVMMGQVMLASQIAMQQIDSGLPENRRGAEAARRRAQRAGIAFRDTGCKAEGFRVAGGSMPPMVVATCLERVTRVRTGDLRALGKTW